MKSVNILAIALLASLGCLANGVAKANVITQVVDQFLDVNVPFTFTVGTSTFSLNNHFPDTVYGDGCTPSGNCSKTLQFAGPHIGFDHVAPGTQIDQTTSFNTDLVYVDGVAWRSFCGGGCDAVFRYINTNLGDHMLMPFAAHSGGPDLFGWVDMKVEAPDGGPYQVYLYGYGYEDSGSPAFAFDVEAADVPTPGALALLCLGLFGVGGLRRNGKAA